MVFLTFQNIFLIILILFFLTIFLQYPLYQLREGLENSKIPIKGSIINNTLHLSNMKRLTQGDKLQTTSDTDILDISGQPLFITNGSDIPNNTYLLSGYMDPSSNLYGQDISMQILTISPMPPLKIPIKGKLITDQEVKLSVISNPIYNIEPGYSLLDSRGQTISDGSDKPVTIVSGSNNIYKLSGAPISIPINTEMDFIIEEN